MNYKEKYNAALERIKSWVNGEHPECFSEAQKAAEFIFPELKENEDERIRNGIIDFIKHESDIYGIKTWCHGYTTEEIISWLEKQGEQKPVDKTESKFHEDDLVVDNYGYVWKIKEILDKCYYLEGVDGGESLPTIEWVNEHFHLWTIEDAKDGDVLCYKDEISLYKHDIKNCTKQETTFGGFVYYCCYDGKRFITDNLYSLTEQDKTDIHPATKEQRDTLFAKMKEVGYKWDTTKKELKKIKVKTLDPDKVIEWLNNNWWYTVCEPKVKAHQIDKFKKDFGL